jgi:hypothetical protein
MLVSDEHSNLFGFSAIADILLVLNDQKKKVERFKKSFEMSTSFLFPFFQKKNFIFRFNSGKLLLQQHFHGGLIRSKVLDEASIAFPPTLNVVISRPW